jgi:hypothetical protein
MVGYPGEQAREQKNAYTEQKLVFARGDRRGENKKNGRKKTPERGGRGRAGVGVLRLKKTTKQRYICSGFLLVNTNPTKRGGARVEVKVGKGGQGGQAVFEGGRGGPAAVEGGGGVKESEPDRAVARIKGWEKGGG